MNIANRKPNKGSVTVTEYNLPTGIIFKNKNLIGNVNIWHKFIIANADDLPRNTLLGIILDHVHPLDLVPVAFTRDQFRAYFLARNCGPAIQKLCKDNLVVPTTKNELPLKIKIVLKFATTADFKVDVQENIMNILFTRYDQINKTLDLTNFCEDRDLTEFCPLSQPKIMYFVFHLSKNLPSCPEKYLLGNNKIKTLNALNGITYNIISLDLSNNLIDKPTSLLPLTHFKLKELTLDGNPLCEKFQAEEYIDTVLNYCSSLEKLDGLPLRDGSFPIGRPIFLCNIDGLDLVNQFLEHYFTVYDSSNRKVIEDLYHKNAMFSINSAYYAGQFSSPSTQLFSYSNISRNLKKLADLSRNREFLYKSSKEIVNVLCSLPLTEHDPFSFKVDLIHYTSFCAVICVSGVFRHLPENLLDNEKTYGFRRTFVLEIMNGEGLCCIVNEQFHVHNAMTWQMSESFKITRPIVAAQPMPLPQTEKEQQQVVNTLKIITNLNKQWSRKCLEECGYNLRSALGLFVDLYKSDKIPKEAFINKNIKYIK